MDHRAADVPRRPDEGACEERCEEGQRRRRLTAAGAKDERESDCGRCDGREAEEGMPLGEPLDRLRSGQRTPASREVRELVGPAPAGDGRREASRDGDDEEESRGRERRSAGVARKWASASAPAAKKAAAIGKWTTAG